MEENTSLSGVASSGCDGVCESKEVCDQSTCEADAFEVSRVLSGHSRKAALWEMWKRHDAFRRKVFACNTVEDLAACMVFGDRFIAVWYACNCRGLRARVLRGARIKARRVSSGCGVNRRSSQKRRDGPACLRDLSPASSEKAGQERQAFQVVMILVVREVYKFCLAVQGLEEERKSACKRVQSIC